MEIGQRLLGCCMQSVRASWVTCWYIAGKYCIPGMFSPCHVPANLALGCYGVEGLDVTCPRDALCISGGESLLCEVEARWELSLLLSVWRSQIKSDPSGSVLHGLAACCCGYRPVSEAIACPLILLTSA